MDEWNQIDMSLMVHSTPSTTLEADLLETSENITHREVAELQEEYCEFMKNLKADSIEEAKKRRRGVKSKKAREQIIHEIKEDFYAQGRTMRLEICRAIETVIDEGNKRAWKILKFTKNKVAHKC